MRVLQENLVNSNTTRDASGKVNPYRRKDILIDSDGNASVVSDKSSPIKGYMPGHRDADVDGYVSFPNINMVEEIVNLEDTLREYDLAEGLLQKCMLGNYIPDYSIQMARRNAAHFWEMMDNRDRLDRIERKLDTLKTAK